MPIGPSATSMGVSTSLDTNGQEEWLFTTDSGHSHQDGFEQDSRRGRRDRGGESFLLCDLCGLCAEYLNPPCGEAMGRWRPVGLTEGLWREVAAPPPLAFSERSPSPLLRHRADRQWQPPTPTSTDHTKAPPPDRTPVYLRPSGAPPSP